MKKILVVDDDTNHAMMLKTLLSDWGYEIHTADDGESGIAIVKEKKFDLILMDMKMARISGMKALQIIKQFNPFLPIIIMTAYSSVQTAVKALKIGAYDYLTKPLDFDKLKLTIERIFENIFLKEQNKDLKKRLEEKKLEHNIIGKSPLILAMFDTIQMAAPTDANVLIEGQSGTGKELVASALHFNSLRKNKNFIKINCAAIAENLLESELFGHEKGAFTGAEKKRKGKFLQADKGSILLDEIGEMSLNMQAKLLRVIQEKEVTPVGSDQNIKIDVRIIASTNKDLQQMTKDEKFRQDLYYRINVVNIAIAPLKERKEDIPLLAQHFLKIFSKKNKRSIKGFLPDAIDAMLQYNWEGNVRQLSNCIERAVVLTRSDYICKQDLFFEHLIKSPELNADLKNQSLSKIEEQAILATLEDVNGNKSETARKLGITRKTLLNKLKQYKTKDAKN